MVGGPGGTMRFRVLGSIEVERDEMPLAVGGPQQRRLLAFLLTERGRVVSTDRLVDALWPDGSAPNGAARSTMSYVSRLRSVLGEDLIGTEAAGYRLALNGHSLDATEFEALLDQARRALPDAAIDRYDEALELWTGPPYGEFASAWWAMRESARLCELRAVAREERAAAMLVIGHRNRAIPDLEMLSLDHPLREWPVTLLVQALHASGRRAEAIRCCRQFRRRLADETGLEPSAELIELERAVIGRSGAVDGSTSRPLRGYTIHDVIGEGRYGRVYSATQPGTQRRVAIKVIRPELADSPAFVRRFEAEAQLVARLEHPHIVPLYDFWREPGGAYLVVRLLTGGTARESVIAGGPWSVERVSRLVEEVGSALIAAHVEGVTHNDVRPANVLLDDAGGAYLTDFGIAVEAGHGERDDVRSFGQLLWELLTGSPPPRVGPSASAGLAGGAVPPLTGLVRSTPEGLDAVLTRATTSADDGYESVAELVLGWRAAIGRPEGVLSPLGSGERQHAESVRRRDARRLTDETAAAANPYVGLRPFDEADVSRFFGRTAMVDELLGVVDAQPLVTVVGASGSGKSSVVRAGLVPRLRMAGRVVITMVPGTDPVGNLRTALREVSTGGDPTDLTAAMRATATASPLVVVVDQLEECWTRSSPEARDELIELLAAATALDAVTVVATIRADLFDRPLQDPTIGPLLGDGAYVVTPMSKAELADAVALPAARAGVSFDDGVVEHLVAESAAQPGSLPLLQFTLSELYARRVDGRIGVDILQAVGGMAGSIGRRAEETYQSLDASARAGVREAFSRLVVPGDGAASDTRRRANLAELPDAARTAIDELVDARLLVTNRDATTREPTIDIAHEALLARWARLTQWVDEDRRWIAQLNHLADAARSWDDAGRGDAELYRGSRLESIVESLDDGGRPIAALERAFVEASIAARDAGIDSARRAARRLRRLLVGVAAALAIALTAGVIAVVQRNNAGHAADRARIEALVGRADAIRATQRDTAALLAVEAFRLADTARTRAALLATFTDGGGFLDTRRLDTEHGGTGIVLPDGKTTFVAGADGRLRPYDLDSGVLGPPFPAVGTDPSPLLTASADGSLVAHAARDESAATTSITTFATSSASAPAPAIVVDGLVEAATFSTDGTLLAVVVGENARLLVFDAATGSPVARAPGVALPEDGSLFVRADDSRDGLYFAGPSSGVTAVGDELVVGSIDGSVRVFDAATASLRTTIEASPHTASTLRAVGDGTVVSSGRSGLALLDPAAGAVRWEHAELETCRNLTVIASSRQFYCADPFGRVVERDLATGLPIRRLDGQNGDIGTLWSADDGAELIAFGHDEPVVARWRLDGSGPITHLVAPGNALSTGGFDPSGERLIVGSGTTALDGGDRVIDVESGELIADLSPMWDAGWRDGDTVVAAVLNDDEVPQAMIVELDDTDVVEISKGLAFERPVADYECEPGKQRCLFEYLEGGRTEITTIEIDGSDDEPVATGIFVDDHIVSTSISRTGHRIAVGTDRGVEVFDGFTGTSLGTIPGGDRQGVAITLTDQLFVGSTGGQLIQYDLDTLEAIRTFGGSTGFVQDLLGNTDGSLIAVRGGDRNVHLYDVDSGIRLGTPIDIGLGNANLIAITYQGDRLAVGGGPNGVQIWDLDPQRWVMAACAVAGRNLTADEWETNIGDLAPYRATCPTFPSDG